MYDGDHDYFDLDDLDLQSGDFEAPPGLAERVQRDLESLGITHEMALAAFVAGPGSEEEHRCRAAVRAAVEARQSTPNAPPEG